VTAGIHAALHQPVAAQLLRLEPQPAADSRRELGVGVVEGEFQLT
jgi:hypothetical protein